MRVLEPVFHGARAFGERIRVLGLRPYNASMSLSRAYPQIYECPGNRNRFDCLLRRQVQLGPSITFLPTPLRNWWGRPKLLVAWMSWGTFLCLIMVRPGPNRTAHFQKEIGTFLQHASYCCEKFRIPMLTALSCRDVKCPCRFNCLCSAHLSRKRACATCRVTAIVIFCANRDSALCFEGCWPCAFKPLIVRNASRRW